MFPEKFTILGSTYDNKKKIIRFLIKAKIVKNANDDNFFFINWLYPEVFVCYYYFVSLNGIIDPTYQCMYFP